MHAVHGSDLGRDGLRISRRGPKHAPSTLKVEPFRQCRSQPSRRWWEVPKCDHAVRPISGALTLSCDSGIDCFLKRRGRDDGANEPSVIASSKSSRLRRYLTSTGHLDRDAPSHLSLHDLELQLTGGHL